MTSSVNAKTEYSEISRKALKILLPIKPPCDTKMKLQSRLDTVHLGIAASITPTWVLCMERKLKAPTVSAPG